PAEKILIHSEKPLFANSEGQVLLGGLSDLVYSAAESNKDKKIFYSVTDRGPNGKEKGGKKTPERAFLHPAYNPQILKFEFKNKRVELVQSIGLKVKVTLKPEPILITGLPNVNPLSNKTGADETPTDSKGTVLNFDAIGLDPEGLALDEQKNFWVSEEYGPSLLKVNSAGVVQKRWLPKGSSTERTGIQELPSFYAKRKLNRGFEALVFTPQKTLLVFLQSGVPHLDKDLAPILEFDPVQEKTVGVYFYSLSKEGGKIGAATLGLDGRIWVLEQNGKVGKKAWQRVFAIDRTPATNVVKEALASEDFKIPPKTKPVEKNEVLNLTEKGLQDFEKLEGLSVDPEGFIYVVNDNDFGVHDSEVRAQNYLFVIKKEEGKK
ncbi:MAG: hypothetical protein OM95_04330, partial [Bdellovibrio sp. ArHS]|uniref:esterase-like activity of phytase family protein n=1 Tax=Bdellovibrio sp. ArHS TaxID=1569284 RepID=UPI000583B1EC